MKILFGLLILFLSFDSLIAQIIDTIPFTKTVGLMRVPIQINGNTYSFIFDTGAESCGIRADLIDEVKAKWLTEDTLYDSHDNKSIQSIYEFDSIKMGNKVFRQIEMISFPNNPMFSCLEIDGIIGVNIIKQCNWIFDFGAEHIEIVDNAFEFKDEGFELITFRIEGLRPKIFLSIDGKMIDFLFDSGATLSEIDSVSYTIIKDDIISSYHNVRETGGVNTHDYKTEGVRFSLNLDFGSKYQAEFNTINIGENKIGNRFWNGNKVYLNWMEQKLAIKTTNNTGVKYLDLSFKIKDNTIVISSLTETEQINENELKIGDKVKSINGIVFENNCVLKKYIDNYRENSLELVMDDNRSIRIMKE